MAAAIIVQAVSELGQSVFGFLGKKQDGKNLEQEGLNDSFQVFKNRFPNPFADKGQSNILIGLFALIIILIVAIVVIKIQQRE